MWFYYNYMFFWKNNIFFVILRKLYKNSMKYSDEQLAIFDFAKNGLHNLIVQSVAGAGKTTTLV